MWSKQQLEETLASDWEFVLRNTILTRDTAEHLKAQLYRLLQGYVAAWHIRAWELVDFQVDYDTLPISGLHAKGRATVNIILNTEVCTTSVGFDSYAPQWKQTWQDIPSRWEEIVGEIEDEIPLDAKESQ